MNRTLWHCPKFASTCWRIPAFYWRIPAKKVRRRHRWRRQPASTPRAKEEEEKESGENTALKHADLGLFYAGVRHLYAPDKCFLASSKSKKGWRKFVYFFRAKKTRFMGSFLDIPNLDRFGCASRYFPYNYKKKIIYKLIYAALVW